MVFMLTCWYTKYKRYENYSFSVADLLERAQGNAGLRPGGLTTTFVESVKTLSN